MPKARALVETLDLFDNYGGVLQAYAMQRLLREQGLAPVTEVRSRKRLSPGTIVWLLRGALKARNLDQVVLPAAQNERNGMIRAFVEDNIATIEPIRSNIRRAILLRHVTFGVSGSDQIWRPAYTNVWRNLFDFPGGEHLRKIAYAGSFGVDELSEFSDSDRERFGRLLQKFHAVSVRETSAQKLLKDNFNIDSTVVLDPTLVIDPKVWHDLADTAPGATLGPYLASMMLDHRGDVTQALNERAAADSLRVLEFYPPKITSQREYVTDPRRFALPTVASWLRTIRDAQLVVTDSFHVCLFSMIFKTPFICLKNQARGATRFDSLEGLLGIRQAFVVDPESIKSPSVGPVVDDRYSRITQMAGSSRLFLRDALRS